MNDDPYRELLAIIHKEAKLAAGMSTAVLDTGTVVATSDPRDGIVVRTDSGTALATDCLAMGMVGGLSIGDRVLVLYQQERYFVVGAIGDALGTRSPTNAYYGSFHSTATQSAALVATAYTISLNATDLSNGVSVVVGQPSRVMVEHAGTYNLQFSLQLDKTTGSTGFIYIWLRQNGFDVANSATKIAVQGTNAQTVAAWNFFFSADANDYVELVWSTSDTNARITAYGASSPVPAVPSVILTVQQVSE